MSEDASLGKTVGRVWSEKHYSTLVDILQYDLTPAQFVMESIELLKQNGVKTILDGGCGQGRHMLYLHRLGFEPIGVDASGNALAICRQALNAHGYGNPRLHCSELDELPLDNNSIDAIVSVTVLTHFFGPSKVLAEFHRVLKPNGILIADAATTKDSTLETVSQSGERAGEFMFFEKGTQVRYYRSPEELLQYFNKFRIIDARETTFWEPGHPGSRTYPHSHTSYVITGKK